MNEYRRKKPTKVPKNEGCSKYACDVHFLLIWMLLSYNYTTIKRLKVELQIPSEDFVYSLAISCCRSLVMILKILKILKIACWQEDLTSYLLVYLNCLEVSYIKCYTLVRHVDPKILVPQISMSALKLKII